MFFILRLLLYIYLCGVKNLKALNPYFLKYRIIFFWGMFFVIISNVFGLFPPQLIRYSLDLIADTIDTYGLLEGFELKNELYKSVSVYIFIFGILILSTSIIRGIFMFFMRQTLVVMSRKIEYDQKAQLYDHYQLLSSSFYKRNNTGDLMSRITEDVSKVRMYVGPAIMYAVNTVALFIMVIYAMFKTNAYLSFWVLLPLPILSFSIYKISDSINKKSEAISKQLSHITSIAQEYFSGIRVLKAFVRTDYAGEVFEKASESYKLKTISLSKTEAFFAPLMLLLIGTSTILAVYIGGNEVIRGRFTAGNIAEFVYYINMLTWPVASIGWVVSLVQRAEASQKRINEFLNQKSDIINPTDADFSTIESIKFDKLSFTYPDTGIKALKDINFEIKVGQKVAIVGRTGSGKSTLAELLLRNYDPTEGALLINNQPLNQLNLSQLRDKIGYVPQDVFLFSETVAENIAFGKENSALTLIKHFAKIAAVDKDIEGLPNKYETIVGERGVTLSGGQKQRISIARALIKDPEIIIFDDCLSAVDANTEKTILDNFSTSLKDKTVFFITHRIFSLFEFDLILVLEDGILVEQGKHHELLKKQGIYAELYQIQQQEELIVE